MNNLTQTLLAGAAICALTTVPATAAYVRAMHVTALHAGHAVNKTKRPCDVHVQHCDYTFVAYSYQPANAPPKTHLIYTYYKWNSSFNLCTTPREKITVAPKKTQYAKIGTATETYSEGCSSGPTVFYGDTWTNKKGVAGDTDYFLSTLVGKFKNNGVKYKGTMDLNVYVYIQ